MRPPRQTSEYEGKYILNEEPTHFQASLAQMVGIDAAAWLQTIHFLTNNPFAYSASEHELPEILKTAIFEGRKFVRIELSQLLHPRKGRLRFFSESTLVRIIKVSEKLGHTIVENLNDSPWDKTKWYALDLDKIKLDEEVFEGALDDLAARFEAASRPRGPRAARMKPPKPSE